MSTTGNPTQPTARRKQLIATVFLLAVPFAVWGAREIGASHGAPPAFSDGESEDELVQTVIEQLKAANPGFDGNADVRMIRGKAVSFGISSETVSDIGPVRALKYLRAFHAVAQVQGQGKLADLSPLEGMDLRIVECWHNPGITHFRALRGMKLRHLDADGTSVETLDDLAGLPLEFLSVERSRVNDISAVPSMPQLGELRFSGCDVKHREPLLKARLIAVSCDVYAGEAEAVLRKHPTIKMINKKTAGTFWSEFRPKEKPPVSVTLKP